MAAHIRRYVEAALAPVVPIRSTTRIHDRYTGFEIIIAFDADAEKKGSPAAYGGLE
jgi:hypothetical protein